MSHTPTIVDHARVTVMTFYLPSIPAKARYDASPSQPDTKKCIQVGRDTYAITSQPETSYTSQDYDSILVIDSSSPSDPKRKSTKQRKPNRHNNRHNKTNSFSGGSKL